MTRRQFVSGFLAATGSACLSGSTEPVVVDLVAARSWLSLGGRPAELLAYNGQLPGPLVSIRPGQDVVVRLRNRLDAPTNLHFHGLHLAPSPGPDDSFLQVPPGEDYEYRFRLPVDHPAGTFWYHPHVHGYSADQVGGGLAGAILVRSELEEAAGLDKVPERVIVLQDFRLSPSGALANPSAMERMAGREGPLVTLSGELQPAVHVSPQGFLRLRFINASSSRFYHLRLDDHPFVVLGLDGALLPAPEERETLLLSPGERADVVVRGDRPPAVYSLWNQPYDRGGGMGPGGANRPLEIARLVYQPDEPADWRIPATLNSIEPLPPAPILRRFVLGQGMGAMGMGGGMGAMSFTINGRRFDMDRTDTSVRVGDVEDWVFDNPTPMDHPMHVHTNAFQIVDGGASPNPAWKDTVLVKAGRQVRIRTRFDDFTGLSVYHCHILDHEDLGMMGALRIA